MRAGIVRYAHPIFEDAILFAYMAYACVGENKWKISCLERLNRAIELSGSPTSHIALFTGMCGLGWTVEHVSRLLSAVSEQTPLDALDQVEDAIQEEDPCYDLDQALIRSLQSDRPRLATYDLIQGYVGIGVYFLERWPRGRSAEGLGHIVDVLEKLAEKVGPGVAWYSPPKESRPEGCYDLGVAHGIPGVLHFLCQAASRGIETQRVNSLLQQAMMWFIAQSSRNEGRARFGAWVTAEGLVRHSRPSWCYGDLGVGAILSQIAELRADANLSLIANDILDNCMTFSPETYEIDDACLCHGAAGAAHIYNRLYQTTYNSRYRDASMFWFERALDMFRPGTGVGGFSKYARRYGSSTSTWEASPDLLDGSIGVALALLGAVSSLEPEWDRLLLLSSRA